MIIDFLLDVLKLLIDWIVSVRPSWTITMPTDIEGVISGLMSYDTILPVYECFTCVTAYCSLVAVMQAWKWLIKIVDWIADVIP